MTQSRQLNFALLFPGESMNSGLGQHFVDAADPRDLRWAQVEKRTGDDERFRSMLGRRAERLKGVLPAFDAKHVDLRPLCSPVRDQGLFESCVGFSLAALVEFLLRSRVDRNTTTCSPHFIWYLARLFEFNSALNVGAQIRDGMRVLAHVGCSPEALDPYDPIAFMPPPEDVRHYEVEALLNTAAARGPSQQAIAAAAKYVLDGYYRLESLDDYKQCLSRGFGFVMSWPVYASALPRALEEGYVDVPKPDEEPVASHTLFVCGYVEQDTEPGGGYLICKGSQGSRRGDRGYFMVPFAYAQPHKDGRPANDAWTAVGLAE